VSDPSHRFERLAQALAAHWDEVLAALSPAGCEELRAVLDDPNLPPGQAVRRIEDLLISSDLDDGHAVMAALDGGSRLLATGVEPDLDPGPSLRWLRERVGLGPEPRPGDAPLAAGAAAVLARLATIDSLPEEEVSRAGVDPALSGLIRLDRGQGLCFPRFQFGPDGSPAPVVLEINRLLDADHDPWGVTDWWVGAHAWLGLAPIELLGAAVGHDRLLAAAAAEGDG
jgi:hypothetical protein